MTLDLVDHHRGSADKYSWVPPFDWLLAYENERWCDEVRYYVDDPWVVRAAGDGVEVARVELDDSGDINPDYAGTRCRDSITLKEEPHTLHRVYSRGASITRMS